ncbi:MAG: hypothetical protein FWH10_02540, partial [Oscillospiraceae bacterium]|nr:hypothetical protein [Oscillospiraceae bacterium]
NEITSEKYREMGEKTIAGLSLFKLTDSAGYSHTIGGRENALATSQAAIALGDVKNNMSVWEKLYLDIRERLYFE